MPPSLILDVGERRSSGCRKDWTAIPPKGKRTDSIPIDKSGYLRRNSDRHPPLVKQLHVRFEAETISLLEDVPCASQMDEEEKGNIWWNPSDLKSFAESAEKVCKTSLLRPSVHSEANSFTAVLERIFEQCCASKEDDLSAVNDQDLKLLARWTRNSHAKRGLEGRMLEQTRQMKSSREAVVHAVLVLHANMKIEANVKAEHIRACSERMTRGSRLFALSLAYADEECVKTKPGISRRSSLVYASDYF